MDDRRLKGRELLPGDTDLTTKMVLAGTYDIKEDRQEWARKQGFFTYNSFEDILADERVDVVLVATPTTTTRSSPSAPCGPARTCCAKSP